jgi:hypothetical protein
MASIRYWVLVTGFICGAAFWLTACGGGDDATPEATPEATPAEPAPAPAASSRTDAAREKALAELGPEHRGDFEGSKDGEIRYSGETEDGAPFTAQLGGDVVVPEGFFDEIPSYPEGVPFSMMEAGDGMSMVTLDSKDDASNIYEFYKAHLDESGWVLENDLTVAGGRIMRAIRGDRRAVLHIQGIDGGTRIGYMLTAVE